MQCHRLAERISERRPTASPQTVARLTLLILNRAADDIDLLDPVVLDEHLSAAAMRLQAAADQHSAMTDELQSFAGEGPVAFTPDRIWTLVRTVKVQSQILELYAGTAC